MGYWTHTQNPYECLNGRQENIIESLDGYGNEKKKQMALGSDHILVDSFEEFLLICY